MARCKAENGDWQCTREARRPGSGLCTGHEGQKKRGVAFRELQQQAYGGRPSQKKLPCTYEGCENFRVNRGLCGGHAKQRSTGTALRPLRRREAHPLLPGRKVAWTWERFGYAYVAGKNGGRRLEHREVMEYILGRDLLPSENIHHLNGVRNDNRPENLELWSTMQPIGQRIPDKLKFAWEIIALYDPDHLFKG